MNGLTIYRRMYPDAGMFIENLRGVEIHKRLIPQPTPWAEAAVGWAMLIDKCVEGTVLVEDAEVLHIDEFADNLTAYYNLRHNKLMLQLMKDFRLGGAFGECVAEGLIHWAESGFCEAQLFWEKYKSFFCTEHNKLCETCNDGQGIASSTSSHV